jgi:hypothetical protein
MDLNARDVLARKGQMASERSGFEAHWDEIIDYMRPDAPRTGGRTGMSGEKTRHKVVDSAGEMAGELLASALHGALTNPATDWFGLRPEDDRLEDRDDVAISCEDATKDMLVMFRSPTARFTPAVHETYLDLVFMGIGHLFMADRRLNNAHPVSFQPRPVSEMYVAEDADGQVDTWARDFQLTARQAAAMPGWKPSEQIRAAANDALKQDEKFDFVQMIMPRRDRYGAKGKAGMPVRNCIVSVRDAAFVYEGGFEESPMVSPRWSKRAGETYGRGPGMKALPDVKMMQRIGLATIGGAELTIQPPLMIPDDGIFGPVRLTRGGLTTVRQEMLTGAGSPIRPIVTNAQVDIGLEFSKRVRANVEMAFYSHLIQINQDYRMTATQVLEISERVMQALGPMLGRIQSEFLGPLIDRVFAMMLRAGNFNFPAILDGQPLKIEYVSPIVRAQQLNEAQSILRAMAAGQQIAAMDGTVVDNYDLDAIVRRVSILYGMPRSQLRADAKVVEIRKARQQASEQIAQRQALGDMVETIATGAKAAADVSAVAPAEAA